MTGKGDGKESLKLEREAQPESIMEEQVEYEEQALMKSKGVSQVELKVEETF